MINDWYQAILDIETPLDQAKSIAIEVTSRLAKEGIITLHPEDLGKTHVSGKFAPGPRFHIASGQDGDGAQAYSFTGGMDVHTVPWVNEYGIVGLEYAKCPICGTEFSVENFDALSKLRSEFGKASDIYLKSQQFSLMSCPACGAEVMVRDWMTEPHVGFCNLVFTFWNWPPFHDWQINVPDIIKGTLGHNAIVTYGRL
ncbi:MAG: hypothetical protein AAF228_06845 [Pseudomonadota bacterium]